VPARKGRWLKASRSRAAQIRAWRADFHERPELAYEEAETQSQILRALEDLGIPFRTFPRFTGVVAQLGADRSGPVVALRADMDGLPVTEGTGWKHASKTSGQMHACGHDVHMAALLGAAAVLRDHESELDGPVTLIFQPAEEQGERGGARPLIERGVLDSPKADFVVGQHVAPEIPLGRIGWGKGPVMAAADRFRIAVGGTGGHAATPHRGPDAILAAAEIIQGLQALVSRLRDPLDPVVVSVGSVHGGTRHNILPEEVVLEGTVRTLHPETRTRMEKLLKQRVRHIGLSMGASVDVAYFHGYPVTVNSPEVTEIVVQGLGEEFGDRALFPMEKPIMGAEDFSRYLERVPGTFLFLGVGDRKTTGHLHSPSFLPSELAPVLGAATLLAATAALQGA
jgi:amidohydrolase